jgi:hypothetical protein
MDKWGEHYIGGMVSSSDQKHRLLKLVEAVGDEGNAYDFHSLLWQRLSSGGWVDVHSISQEEFSADCPNRRWVSEIHSFDPTTGRAIMSVGEGDAPEGSESINYAYSWREWDLNKNAEISFFRECEDPWEPYENDAEGS